MVKNHGEIYANMHRQTQGSEYTEGFQMYLLNLPSLPILFSYLIITSYKQMGVLNITWKQMV